MSQCSLKTWVGLQSKPKRSLWFCYFQDMASSLVSRPVIEWQPQHLEHSYLFLICDSLTPGAFVVIWYWHIGTQQTFFISLVPTTKASEQAIPHVWWKIGRLHQILAGEVTWTSLMDNTPWHPALRRDGKGLMLNF